MARIEVLSPHIVNKIAAGEVIERPASVVKELVENSIDAEATRIEVAVEEGGTDLIRVADDGRGIEREDLPLVFESHATSKLRDPEDLFHIETMGFRGEALASIGSVASATLRTGPRGEESGWETTMTAGEPGEIREAPPRRGTSIEIRNLFANVPVRRRFLKSTRVELGHVTETMTRFALSYPEIAFDLTHGNREVFRLERAESQRERIAQLFSEELAGGLIDIHATGQDFELEGWIAPPHHDRPRQDRIFLFLNRRYIRDRSLYHAIHEGYRGFLMTRRYPTVFLKLQIDPREVDVNVHPTKIEVRIRNSGPLHQATVRAIRSALEGREMTPRVPVEPIDRPDREPRIRESVDRYVRSMPDSPRRTGRRIDVDPPRLPRREPPPEVRETPRPVEPDPVQIHQSFILRENDDGFTLTDQHALHERILYHRILDRVRSGAVIVQRLLIPEVIDLSASETQQLLSRGEELKAVGFEVERFGDRSVAVQAVPDLLRRLSPGDLIQEVLRWLGRDEAAGGEKGFQDAVIEMAACKGAIKAGDRLTVEEMRDLLLQGDRLPTSYSCPHGRPTTVAFSMADLERWFRRK